MNEKKTYKYKEWTKHIRTKLIILKPVTWFLTLRLFWFVTPDPESGSVASSHDTNWNSDNVPLKTYWIVLVWNIRLRLYIFKYIKNIKITEVDICTSNLSHLKKPVF